MEDRQPDRESRLKDDLAAVAKDLYDYLGKTFPVCCLSDEFHYFPQIVPPRRDWPGWDNFTPDSLSEAVARLSSAESALDLISQETKDAEVYADAETLQRMARALGEQLAEVRFHETQPTFHLTVMCTALAASLGEADRRAWNACAETLPSFLKRAEEILIDMPGLFRDLGLGMVRDIEAWLRSLEMERGEPAPVFSALERFANFLKGARTRNDFLLPPEIVERIVRAHLGCGAGPDELRNAIKEEIAAMGRIMEEAGKTLFPGGRREAHRKPPVSEVAVAGRRETLRKFLISEVAAAGREKVTGEAPLPSVSANDLPEMYRKEAEALLGHCLARGIVPADLPRTSPLTVLPLPPYLRAIRAASAYSFTPANPSRKGTFYIVPPEGPWNDNREELAEYRMLTAHETYPGHHLLDAWRWHLVSELRRPVENPLFYEGWACFAEELMRETGYFSGPADVFLLAKRRCRRAVRGLVDLDLQTGKLTLRAAARRLVEAGFPAEAAASVVPKYALRPGYQVCYTIGLRRFIDLYRRYGEDDAKGFVVGALSGGEIGFDLLERKLKDSQKMSLRAQAKQSHKYSSL